MKSATYTLLLLPLSATPAAAEDGYRLGLRYDRIRDNALLRQHRDHRQENITN